MRLPYTSLAVHDYDRTSRIEGSYHTLLAIRGSTLYPPPLMWAADDEIRRAYLSHVLAAKSAVFNVPGLGRSRQRRVAHLPGRGEQVRVGEHALRLPAAQAAAPGAGQPAAVAAASVRHGCCCGLRTARWVVRTGHVATLAWSPNHLTLCQNLTWHYREWRCSTAE